METGETKLSLKKNLTMTYAYKQVTENPKKKNNRMEQDELSFNRVPRCGKSPLKRKPAITNNEIAKKMRFKVQFRPETKTNKQSLRNRKRKPKTVYN